MLIVDSGLSGKVKKENQIGSIASWGPQFRVSLDLKINRHLQGDKTWGWSEVLVFAAGGESTGSKGNLVTIKKKNGDRIPAIFIDRDHKPWGMFFSNYVNMKENHFRYTDYQQHKWQRVEISQLREGDGKVETLIQTVV